MLRPRLQATYADAISGAELQSPAQSGVTPLRHEKPANTPGGENHVQGNEVLPTSDAFSKQLASEAAFSIASSSGTVKVSD